MEIETIIQELRLAHYELKDEKIITEGAIRAIEHTMELLKEQEEEIKAKNARIWELLCEKEQ